MNIEQRAKSNIINQNIYDSAYGKYSELKFAHSELYIKTSDTIINKISSLSNLSITLDHSIDCLKNQHTIIYMFGTEFIGTNYESREGIIDDSLLLKSNIIYSIKNNTNNFPLNNNTVVYMDRIYQIRDKQLNNLPQKHLKQNHY